MSIILFCLFILDTIFCFLLEKIFLSSAQVIPFSVRKGYTVVKWSLKMLKVCLHNPIRLQHFITQWKLNDGHQKMIDRRVIGVGEPESEVSFSKKICLYCFFRTKDHFFAKNNFFIRVDRRVIGVEEFEFEVIFFNFFCVRFF
jgi:hypothetical protein